MDPETNHNKRRRRILVVGDVMLDRYTWGDATRVSPEAPVVVLKSERQEVRAGGAAAVAHLVSGFGANVDVELVGVTGPDGCASVLQRVLQETSVQCRFAVDASRPTTIKERFIGYAAGRHPHQMLRVDHESSEQLAPPLEDQLLDDALERLAEADAVLISDYGKGVCTPRILSSIIGACRDLEVPVAVDPANRDSFEVYRGATVLKPNRQEAGRTASRQVVCPQEAGEIAAYLRRQLEFDAVLVTLDRDGIVLQDAADRCQFFPTEARSVYDITGAGDMVLAVLGLAMSLRMALPTAAVLANAAAGLEIEEFGVTQVPWGRIRTQLSPPATASHVTDIDEVRRCREQYQNNRQRVVFTNGCFDLLHEGHVHSLRRAAALGDVLIVGINSDATVRRLKGDGRPVLSAQQRVGLLDNLDVVDHVVVFDDDTPVPLLRRLRPDILVKGGEYGSGEVVGEEVVCAYGGRVVAVPMLAEISTSRIMSALARSGRFSIPTDSVSHAQCEAGHTMVVAGGM